MLSATTPEGENLTHYMLNLSCPSVCCMNRHERIARAIAMSGKQKQQIAKECGVSGASVSQWISGDSKSMKPENLYRLAGATGFNPEWLAIGEGPEKLENAIVMDAETHRALWLKQQNLVTEPSMRYSVLDQAAHIKPNKPLEKPPIAVPVVGKAQLGNDGFFEETGFPTGHGDEYLDINTKDKNAYGLRVVGSSMMPRIRSGEYVLIEPGHPYHAGDEVMVKTADGRAMIKEFIYHRDGHYRFDSVNSNHPPIIIEESQVDKIHYVAAILKSSVARLSFDQQGFDLFL
jgi:phage repressor protein C with HTH and peptisase S24 domain